MLKNPKVYCTALVSIGAERGGRLCVMRNTEYHKNKIKSERKNYKNPSRLNTKYKYILKIRKEKKRKSFNDWKIFTFFIDQRNPHSTEYLMTLPLNSHTRRTQIFLFLFYVFSFIFIFIFLFHWWVFNTLCTRVRK